MYEDCVIIGDYYDNRSKRYKTRIVDSKGQARYITRARFIMEKHINRKLGSHELVHHKNEKTQDDRVENLEIVTRGGHVLVHRLKYKRPTENQIFICPTCDKEFTLSPQQIWNHERNERLQYRTLLGPFCSPSCSGKCGTAIRTENERIRKG